MESCYVPNNPQFGISLEFNGGYLACDAAQLCCEGLQNCACPRAPEDCGCQGLNDLGEVDCSGILDGECGVSELGGEVVSADAGAAWGEDMGSFSLPALDLEPLPNLFPFSPCSGNYKGGGECRERGAGAGEAADVLLSLKHAPVHDCGGETQHPQVLVSPPGGGYPYYEQYAPPPLFPTMSVNVSMNMTMHGYPPEQMCPQVQWSQSSTPPAYAQSQAVLSPTYPSATYSFTADFRAPPDPLAAYKPLSGKPQPPNYSIFQKQQSFGSHSQKVAAPGGGGGGLRRSSVGAGAGYAPAITPEYVYPGCLGGKVQVGALSGCSEEDDQKPNLCRICGKTYARPSTLKTHLRTHSGERPYRCGDCDKSFSQAANLTAHVRTHTGQKPFRCPICDRRFSQSSSVTTHMRTHSGERPYRCRACKKAFSDSSTLTKHLRIHSGEKPYQCKLCLLRFSQSGNLNRHMRVHGNNASLLG